jgi:flagellar assembly protein FliH
MALDAAMLFADDFDLPPEPAEPEVIVPVFSATELAQAREAGKHDGRAIGLAEAAASNAAATRQAIEAIASELATTRDAAAREATEAAEGIARLLLDSLSAVLPTLCAQHGEAEVQALVRAVLPALSQEPEVTVRVTPPSADAVSHEIAKFDPDLAARVHVVPCETLPIGDVRITWRNGTATRDAAALWQQVAAILTPAGLLTMETLNGQ